MYKIAILTVGIALAATSNAHSQFAEFEFKSRPVTELEIADGAPAGTVVDMFVTTDRDMHYVSLYDVVPQFFYQHDSGSDTSSPHSLLVENYPALGADSWITTFGTTAIVGDGFQTNASVGSPWFDFTNDGPVTNFQFGRLTVPYGSEGFLYGEITLRGAQNRNGFDFPFELTMEADGNVSWEFPDPALLVSYGSSWKQQQDDPVVVVTPPASDPPTVIDPPQFEEPILEPLPTYEPEPINEQPPIAVEEPTASEVVPISVVEPEPIDEVLDNEMEIIEPPIVTVITSPLEFSPPVIDIHLPIISCIDCKIIDVIPIYAHAIINYACDADSAELYSGVVATNWIADDGIGLAHTFGVDADASRNDPVPEPGSLAILITGILGLLRRPKS